MQNFRPIGARGWERGPKWQKFPLFGKESPCRGEFPLTDLYKGLLYAQLYPALVFNRQLLRAH